MIRRLVFIFAAMITMQTCSTICPAASLPQQAAMVADTYVGKIVEKTNNNDHPQITKWLKEIGLPSGLSWCAAAGIGVYREAAEKLGMKSPLPRMGRCSSFWDYCRQNQLRFQTFSPDEAMMLGLRAGDIVIWRHGRGVARNFDGHFGIVPLNSVARSFPCDEGNTVQGASGGQREQSRTDRNKGGYYRRIRGLGFGTSFAVEGFIRVRT